MIYSIMVSKQEYIRIGQIITIIGGILFVIGAIVLILSYFIESFTLNSVTIGLIIGTPFYIVELHILILTVLCVIFGTSSIILVGREKFILYSGIIIILLGIIGLGIPGLFIVIGGSIYVVASTRSR